ncbi:uncharacterized protein J7T54_006693 [Emericellopsis cladophorae]|uniref:Beta-lactamase-related domain-containing protein n=1 Tax=Emericellopsis cladophorae TaxID=2686198 RepID=A0A9P9Y703_9HYPO|nr:uncharacterized protein J7T54_006693 [Emericellopsis cladophorae]KAI6784647.1 hypothetical protein J7T54_006693 [Emericellopsis cladophorae]
MKPEFFSVLGALATLSGQTIVAPEAGLAGPSFPAPSVLRGSKALTSAITDFDGLVADSPIVQANETAWAVAVFSTHDDEPLYERYFTPEYDVGVPEVDRSSVFRIASVSKVFSVWTFLAEVGDERFNDPITKYVPELVSAQNNCASSKTVYDDIDHVRWHEVTLGQLASHLAGIPRDPAQGDMSAELAPEQAMALGFPTLPDSDIPTCGVTGLLRACTRKEMISLLLKQHPIFSTGHAPAYSNVAYALLGFAQEAITGTPVSNAITTNILAALNMTSSSFETAPASGGVIPGDASAVGWDWDLGTINPAGSMYCSTGDMVKAGQAILGSKTTTPAQTRRWLKPMSQTGVLGSAVGAPWEIRHLNVGGRLSQLYTKQGDTGGYRAAFVLSPEHDLGAVIFSAGPLASNSAAVRETLMNAVGKVFLPMAEEQARIEARENFAGVYTDEATNSSLTIHVDEITTGLQVSGFTSRGVEIIGPQSPFIPIYGAGQSARLFPSTLRTVRTTEDGTGTYTSRLGFRASFFNVTGGASDVQDPGLMQWTSLGAPAYGERTLDDWVVEMGEDGRARAVDVRMMRLKLGREGA